MSTIIDLGKLRFQFRGQYSASSQYEYNDVVKAGGDVFCYINATATVGTAPGTTTHWASMVSGLEPLGAWNSSTTYSLNSVVVHGGSTYRASTESTNQVPPNASYWELLAGGFNFRGTWATATAYEADDSVVYLGQSYRAKTNHTSAATFLADLSASNWERYAAGSSNRGAYTNSTSYFKGDLVQTGSAPNLDHFVSLTDHTSDATSDPGSAPEDSNWTRLIAGQYTTTTQDRQYAYFIGIGF